MHVTKPPAASLIGLIALVAPTTAEAQVAVAPARDEIDRMMLVETLLTSFPDEWTAPPAAAPPPPEKQAPPADPAQNPRRYDSEITEYTVDDQVRWKLTPRCKRTDLRATAGFGVGAGVQGGGLILTVIVGALAGELNHEWHSDEDPPVFWDNDKKLAIVGGVYLGLGALIGSAAFKIVIRSAQCWTAPWAPILLGGMAGAAAAWGAGFAYLKSDVDNRFGSIAMYGLVPILLPALGELLGYLASRRPADVLRDESPTDNEPAKRVAYSPPSPTVVMAQDGSGRMLPGFTLGRLTF